MVGRDKAQHVIGSRWHFALKYGPDIKTSRYKARFEAKGFSQIAGKDYNEIYSPTTTLSTIRVIINVAVQKGLKLMQMRIAAVLEMSKLTKAHSG